MQIIRKYMSRFFFFFFESDISPILEKNELMLVLDRYVYTCVFFSYLLISYLLISYL